MFWTISYSKAAETSTSSWLNSFNQGKTALAQNRLSEAEQSFLSSEHTSDPEQPQQKAEAMFALALVKYQANDYKGCEKILSDLTKAEEAFGGLSKLGAFGEPNKLCPSSYIQEVLGDIRSMQGEPSEAKQLYEKALKTCLTQKGAITHQQKRLDQKISNVEQPTKDFHVTQYLEEYSLACEYVERDRVPPFICKHISTSGKKQKGK
ncbi:MAG TPA: hypothetical protein V6C86_10010 [Oculatellaceae cyanobacterium]